MTLWLGVDFGTSNTVAVVRRNDDTVEPLLFDGSPLLPSGVFVGPDGAVLTGADAERAVAAYPAGYEPNPKRRIDDGGVWLGDREVAVVDLVAAVLARVVGEARRVTGRTSVGAVLAHPVAWSQTRLGILAEAGRRAGVEAVGFVAEPVAAAGYFARGAAVGQSLVVYDLGAGTFDVSVVRRTPTGFEVVAADGLADLGGLDLDGLVVGSLRRMTPQAGGEWTRLDRPRSPADLRANHTLWRGARAAKEQLSRHPSAGVHMPLADVDLHLTRAEFEAAARPLLERTVAVTAATIGRARPDPAPAGLFLVGGSSRIPLAATLLHQTLHLAPTVIDQPELVVARGSLAAVSTPATGPSVTMPGSPMVAPRAEPMTPPPWGGVSGPPSAGVPAVPTGPAFGPAPSSGSRRRVAVGVLVAVVVLVVMGVGGWFVFKDQNQPDGREGTGQTQLTLLSASGRKALDELTGNRLAAKSGAVVAIDPNTGALLLAVSTPAPPAGTATGGGILDDNRRALANGAFAKLAPPGAAFHAVVAAMALGRGTAPQSQVPAGEEYTPPGTTNVVVRNAAAGCGAQVSLEDALVKSCNTAFARLCVQFGGSELGGTARKLGFDTPDLFADAGKDLFQTAASTTGALTGITPLALAQTCLGQRDARMTALTGALMAGAAANGGRLLRPYVVAGNAKTEELGRALDGAAADQWHLMMVAATGTGTAQAARIAGVEVGGTAGVGETGESRSGWFIGFASRNNKPVVAVAVLLENAGPTAGGEAARIAGQVMAGVIGERG